MCCVLVNNTMPISADERIAAMAEGLLNKAQELLGKDEGFAEAEVAASKALGLYREGTDDKDSKNLAEALRCLVDLKIAGADKPGALRIVREEVAAVRENDKFRRALLLTVQAEVNVHMDNPVEALELGRAARAILHELGKKIEEVNTIATGMLTALCMQRDSGGAVDLANEMLAIGWQTGDTKTQAQACQCALHAWVLSGSREALEVGRRAVQLNQQINDKEQEAASLVALANAHLHMEDFSDAARTSLEAVNIARELGLKKLFAMCFQTRIQSLIALKQVPEAIFWADDEIKKAQKANDQKLEALISPSTVTGLWAMGSLDGAAKKAETCAKLFQGIGDRKGEAGSLKALAEIQLQGRQLESAEAALQSALALYRDLNESKAEKECLVVLDHICVAKGDPDGAPNRAEALTILRELSRALEERNVSEFKKLSHRFDSVGGVTDEDIQEIFAPAVNKDPDASRNFIVKHIGHKAVNNANALDQQRAQKSGNFFKIVERALLYQNFRNGGMGYGPHFRCLSVTAARSGQGEAVAVMRMTSESECWEHELLLGGGPGIMDCALQTGAASAYTGVN